MAISGVATLRAYRKFDYFKIQFMEAIDKSANSTFCFFMVHRWIGMRLDLLVGGFSIASAAFAVLFRN